MRLARGLQFVVSPRARMAILDDMTPDWLFHILWFSAGIGGTGALWYFLSQKDYHSALWTGYVTAVVVLLAVVLHIRNDILRRERNPALVRSNLSIELSVPRSPQPSAPPPKAATSPTADVLRPVASEAVPPAEAAEAAAEHYRRTSPTLKREEIRQAYREYCDRIASRFGLPSWAPVNQLTRMVTTNLGDSEAFARGEAESPAAAWMAIRVLVAFETPRERPMYMSYVFIGRTPVGEEVVAWFNELKQWSVLSRSSSPSVSHEQLMIETIRGELHRLGEKIAPDIRRLG